MQIKQKKVWVTVYCQLNLKKIHRLPFYRIINKTMILKFRDMPAMNDRKIWEKLRYCDLQVFRKCSKYSLTIYDVKGCMHIIFKLNKTCVFIYWSRVQWKVEKFKIKSWYVWNPAVSQMFHIFNDILLKTYSRWHCVV